MTTVAQACPDDDSGPSVPVSLPAWFPALTSDGQIPVGESRDGSPVFLPLHDPSRVWHGAITGATGTGKGASALLVLWPGVVAGLETVLLADGERGTGFPFLRSAVSRYARLPQQWSLLIEMAHRVMLARLDRRAAAGLAGWNTPTEAEPIVTLVLDEVGAIKAHLSGRHACYVQDMLSLGGSVGIRVVQITWSLGAEDVIGGVVARDRIASDGWVIRHRGARGFTGGLHSGADVDLRQLRDGQAAVWVRGDLVADPARMRYLSPERVTELLPALSARHLRDDDLVAAGPDYNAAHWDDCWSRGYVFLASPEAREK